MRCPKCKKEIEENSLVCEFCHTKVGSICTKCGTFNPITAIECENCKKVLLKICNDCGSANRPKAKTCRKCGKTFDEKSIAETSVPEYQANVNSQQKVKAKLLEGIKDIDKKIITVSGMSGLGKNLVLRSTIQELKNANLIWLLGTCTQVTQLSPFGYFQDLLLGFFNINNFCPDTLQLKKNSIKFFKQDFPTLTNSEVHDLLNFLYPEQLDRFENIYFNKAKMFVMLKKVILTIVEKMKVIFIVDGFEFIDGMSYDFINELLKDEVIQDKTKFIILTEDQRPGLGMINSQNLDAENYLDLSIAPFSAQQVEIMLKQYTEFNFSKDFIKMTNKVSKGNPSIIEQMVLLQKDIKRNGLKNIIYNSLEDIITYRLNILKREDYSSYRMLVAMSILGVKFYPALLEKFDNISLQEFERIIEYLVNNGYIVQLNNLSFEFKSSDIWKVIVSLVKNDEAFEEILNVLLELLSSYKQSSVALLAYIVQKLNNNDQAFDIWTLLMKQATYIGDIGLYIIVQKQALKLIESKQSEFFQKVKKNINTRLGKILEPIDYSSAFEYLHNAIMMLGDDEDYEHIELLGYLASCSMQMGNYCGAIECIESVLNKLPEEMEFEKTLVKSRLVKPLLKLGNYGQLVNLVDLEILPQIEKVLARGRNVKQIKLSDLFELWLNLYLDYAEALVFQGDNKAFDVIQTIYDILDKNQVEDAVMLCKTNLLLALANTIKGEIKISNDILDDILKENSLDNMDTFIVSRWNFIDILNKFFNKAYNTLYAELFNVVAYANNVNDNFTKNILKTLLAKILKDKNETKKALEILEEQVTYFAKEKVATGVLLSWYLIAEIKLITNGTQFALDIANKALDIAQGPNINNYYFVALFNKLIGEIYMAKQDFESSKVYLEKALFIAKQFDLQFVLLKTYLLSARLYQELALPKSAQRNEYVKQALKMFQFAKNLPIVAENQSFQKDIKSEFNLLTSFCKLNGIVLKKDK